MSNYIWIILLLVAAALAVVFFRKRQPQEEPAETNNQPAGEIAAKPVAKPAAKPSAKPAAKPAGNDKSAASPDDKMVLEQLREAGSDLSKPHVLEFYLYFPAEQSAHQAAEKLESEGFEGELKPSVGEATWLCLVRKRMVPELNEIVAMRRKLSSLAKEFKGEYDGWETRIEK